MAIDLSEIHKKNAATVESVLDIASGLNPMGGYFRVCQWENQRALASVSLRNKEVLDVGCGSIPTSVGIPDNDMPKIYIAVDTDISIINAARRMDHRPSYKIGIIEDLHFVQSTFDVVILKGVLHHLEKPTECLKTVLDLLKPDGQLIIYEPNLSCGPANLAKWILWRYFKLNMEASPYGQLPISDIHSFLHSSGFKLHKQWYASLFAFALTGDYGRKPILPDSKVLFNFIIGVERQLSKVLHFFPPIARFLHWRVVFLAIKN